MSTLQRASGSKSRKQVVRRKIGGNKSSMKLLIIKSHSHKRIRNSSVQSEEIKFIFERTLPSSKQSIAFLQGIKYAIHKILEKELLIFFV